MSRPMKAGQRALIYYSTVQIIYLGADVSTINPLKAELNPICHLLALAGAHHFVHVSRARVNMVLKKYDRLQWTGLD